jgi:hypothetical protein
MRPPAYATPITIYGNQAGSINHLANFTATLTYSYKSSTSATLTIQLTNSTTGFTAAYLTGFVFNNPNDQITKISLTNPPGYTSISLTFSNGNVKSDSSGDFGKFDVGVTVGGSSNPTAGIAMGNTATFTFTLTGTSLNTLTEQSFVNASSSGGSTFFAAQFSGINPGNKSDNVPGTLNPTATPEPGTMLLLASGIVGLGICRKMKFKGKG